MTVLNLMAVPPLMTVPKVMSFAIVRNVPTVMTVPAVMTVVKVIVVLIIQERIKSDRFDHINICSRYRMINIEIKKVFKTWMVHYWQY